MLSVAAVQDKNKIKEYFKENTLEFFENCGCMEAKCGKEVLGFCLYSLFEDKMTIYKIVPENDFLLADGVLRSTLHLADRRGIVNVYCTSTSESFCRKAGFIKNAEEMLLDISLLSKDCRNGCNSK